MNVALRLLVACFVITAPTVLFLGLVRGLEKLRDDALLMRLAENDEVPEEVSLTAARNVETGPILTDGRGADEAGATRSGSSAPDRSVTSEPPRATDTAADAFVCTTCGESNMVGARYCRTCLTELER